jgi:hypothetical protein
MFTYPGGRMTASLCTLKMLIEQAFDLQEFQVSGGPAWAGDLRWNLEARRLRQNRLAHIPLISSRRNLWVADTVESCRKVWLAYSVNRSLWA